MGIGTRLNIVNLFTRELPRAEVIHLANASLNLTTMVSSIWFPIQAGRTPRGTTIRLADKHISFVEAL